MKFKYGYETKLGMITIIEDNGFITNVCFGDCSIECTIRETEIIKQAILEINEYLDGKRKSFDIKINLNGTCFQKKVWNELLKIPYGTTCSYGDIAKKLGSINYSRAVGMANHNNPIPIIVPCHRVIGKNGLLVGYAGGLDIKRKLLDIESKN